MGIKEALIKTLSLEVIVVVCVLAMWGMWLWALGKVPIPGEHGFVLRASLSGDVQTIVGEDVEELKRESKKTSKQVQDIKIALDQILADYYAQRIKDGVRRRCKLNPLETQERDRLWDQINEDLNMYRVYSGDMEYQRPSCSEV